MIECAGCPRVAEYEVYTGKLWQPHCKVCANEAMECKEGSLIRRINTDGYADTDSGER